MIRDDWSQTMICMAWQIFVGEIVWDQQWILYSLRLFLIIKYWLNIFIKKLLNSKFIILLIEIDRVLNIFIYYIFEKS